MTTESNKSDAARLAAVLRVLIPDESIRHDKRWTDWRRGRWEVFSTGLVRVLRTHHDGTHWWADKDNDGEENECFDPTSKDDLARVVAMLSPGQLAGFDSHFCRYFIDGVSVYSNPVPSSLITAPASVWLAALAAATGVA